jgi:hypothetical protein
VYQLCAFEVEAVESSNFGGNIRVAFTSRFHAHNSDHVPADQVCMYEIHSVMVTLHGLHSRTPLTLPPPKSLFSPRPVIPFTLQIYQRDYDMIEHPQS